MQLKICGFKNYSDLLEVAKLDVDYVGLNFVNGSPRQVDFETAKQFLLNLKQDVPNCKTKIVAVLFNPNQSLLQSVISSQLFQVLQFHGNESVDFLTNFKQNNSRIKIWKALKVTDLNIEIKIKNYSQIVNKILLDMPKKADFSSADRTFSKIELFQKYQSQFPLILAGGLNAKNLSSFLSKLRPAVIDIASGVEATGFKKDLTLIQTCVKLVKSF